MRREEGRKTEGRRQGRRNKGVKGRREGDEGTRLTEPLSH
jgi:hypothetical protein